MNFPPGERQKLVPVKVVELSGRVYIDQTVRFPVISSVGNKYVIVLHDYDMNAILVEQLRDKVQQEMVSKRTKLHKHLVDQGYKIKTQILDNECSDASV